MSGIGRNGVDLVAVVGLSCRLPGASDPAAFWGLVREGREAITALGPERAAMIGEQPGRPGGWLDDVTGFDADFFGIGVAEAVAMDPQQRLALELTHHAFESAGLDRAALDGSRTGVFVGTIGTDYAELLDPSDPGRHDMTGVARSMIANRISYAFGLRGPSLAVDSGQSSSLVAVHLAAEALRSGDADVTVAGGVNLLLSPVSTARSAAFGGLSPRGRCRTFDERADGYVRGEGGAFVVLKRLDRAVLDGDPVLAVLAGSAVGNDGTTDTLTTPSAAAQSDVVREACARTGIAPSVLQYVELHGTGTPVGDPLEAAALGGVAGVGRPADAPLAVGSVKTNVGHLEGAAGVVGLTKVVLALAHAELPPSLNFTRAPASIPLAELGLRVHTELTPWPGPLPLRYAGVSSFGMGGTNCHVVMTAAPSTVGPRVPDLAPTSDDVVPWVLSARSRPALGAVAEAIVPLARPDRSRGAIGAALIRRDAYEHRAVALTRDGLPTAGLLEALAAGTAHDQVVTGAGAVAPRGGPVLVFPGQGAQWVGMGADLLVSPAGAGRVFADRLHTCSQALLAAGGPDAAAVLRSGDSTSLDDVAVVQPVSWAVMVALAALWAEAGVTPSAVVGHSQGEIAAATVAGVLSLAEAAHVVTARSSMLRRIAGPGGMLSVEADADTVAGHLDGTGLALAARNGPTAAVVSGAAGELDVLAGTLRAVGVRCRRVAVDYASHSPAVDAVIDDVIARIGTLAPRPPAVPWLSTVTADWVAAGDVGPHGVAGAAYWARNLRDPVRYADGVEALVASGRTTFVEASPHPVLLGATESTAARALAEGSALDADPADPADPVAPVDPVVLATLRRGDGGPHRVLRAVAEAWVAGVDVDWSAVMPPAAPFPPYGLPLYPFRHRAYWPGADLPEATGPEPAAGPPGGGTSPEAVRSAMLDVVLAAVAAHRHRDPDAPTEARVDATATFRDLGVDSVGLVELRGEIGRTVGRRLTSVLLFDHPTPARLADRLAQRALDGAPAEPRGTGPHAAPTATGRTPVPDDPIVVVGAACRFPGGIDSPRALWAAVRDGRDLTSPFPTDRGWPADLVDPDPDAGGHTYVGRGGFLPDAAEFDAGFFGISPREATAMDPQQRLLLTCAWETFERAGADPAEPDVVTGVFLGATAQDYGPRMDRPADGLDGYLLTGTTPSVASGRIAYVLGLEGPALTVDTACSSSLVALHLALRSLRDGECDRAIVGGATVNSTPGLFVEFSRQRGLAPDGHCKPFAAAADGTGWSEGAGTVLLERLSAARVAGHRVLGVLRGSAVNSDGASNGLSAPSGRAQQRVITDALTAAGLSAAEVDAVEAHGTGTALGDPVEAHALLATYGAVERATPLSLGAAKSVLGHTQAAAGVAGLLVTLLALEHDELPAVARVDAPSAHVDWDTGAVALRVEATPWRPGDRPRRAGVSAFGISGTNAHVVVEEAPPAPEIVASMGGTVPWFLSAADDERLDALVGRIDEGPHDPATAAALAIRPALPHRAARVGDVWVRGRALAGARGVVLVFPGQGTQWVGMARELLDGGPDGPAGAFTARFAECSAALGAAGGPDAVAVLRSDAPDALDDVAVVQPVTWAVMVSLAAAWSAAGVEPAAVVGHSQGEIAAAVVAGALTVADAARIVTARGTALRAVAGSGAMASVGEPVDVVRRRLVGGAGIAAVNAPSSTVVSGPVDDVAAVVAAAVADGRRTRVLPVDYASHSPGMAELRDEVLAAIGEVRAAAPRVPWFSAVHPGPVDEAPPAAYWMDNLVSTVRFADAVAALTDAGHDAFVEVSAHPVLTAAVAEVADEAGHQVVACGTLRRDEGGPDRLLTALATAWTLGVPVDRRRLVPALPVPADLPTYPFRRDRYWATPTPAESGRTATDPLAAELWTAAENGDVERVGAALRVEDDATLPELLPRVVAWRRRRTEQARADGWRYRETWQPVDPPAGSVPVLVVEPEDLHGLADRVGRHPGAAVVLREPRLTDILEALRAVAGTGSRLWAATRGAVAATPADPAPDPAGAGVWGLGRVAALEQPRDWGGLVDLGPDVPAGAEGDALAGVLGGDEDQMAVRGGRVLARRLIRARVGRVSDPALHMHGTALVTGGTGALGAHVARWLVDAGVTHLVLAGRRGAAAPGAAEVRAELEASGARVDVVACDVADRAAVAALVDAHPPSVVVHAAGVVQLATLAELDGDELADVLRAKADGAENLDAVLGDTVLDAFVLFSSISGVWGVADHGAYAAANARLDALARRRAAAGRTALSVAWGPWAGGGMIDAPVGDLLARRGVPLLDPATALAGLARAIVEGDVAVAVADVDWPTFAPVFTSTRPTRLLDALPEALAASGTAAGRPSDPASGSDLASRAAADPEDAPRVLLGLVRTELAEVLGHRDAASVDPDRAFSDLGVDSLGAVALRRRLRAATGVGLETTVVFDHPTPARLAAMLTARLVPTAASATPTTTAAGTTDGDPLVLVGAACRFPGGIASPEDLWAAIDGGRDLIGPFPTDRGWATDLVDPDAAAAGRSTVDHGGFLDDAAGFDAAFFGISPREALAVDPQQRLLLECAWEAFERAGIDPRSRRGTRTGVYVGLADQGWGRLLEGDGEAEGHLVTGAASSVASGRIAYVLGLEGPALTLDTACSSSLVALHLAMAAIRDGSCDQALVGGVMVMSSPDQFTRFSRQGALAPDGRSKPFAAAADGFALSEGAAVVVVERLSAARAAGHPVLGLLRGSAVNSDGASNGLSAPSGPAQQRVIADALAAAGLGPSDVDVVEAHGTGTALGDPIEAGALLATYGAVERAEPLHVGSVKSNLGHTQTAAGLAGLISTTLAFEHARLPATLHLDAPSPHVEWTAGAVQPLAHARDWPAGLRPRRAGISSFGISGTNAHVIVEEPPAPEAVLPAGPSAAAPVPWLLSARTPGALAALAGRLAERTDLLGADPAAVAAALRRRTAFEERAVVVGDRATALAALARGEVPAGAVRGTAVGRRRGAVLVFPGQGAQWAGMGAELLGGVGPLAEAFAARLRECSEAVVAAGGPDVVAALTDRDPLDDVGVVQPASWAVMVALAATWDAAGVAPAAVVGHSQGELAAAVVAGALDLAEGARIVTSRAAALRSLAGTGAMASVAADADRVADLLDPAGAVSVAVVNSPGATVIAGPADEVAAVVAAATGDGLRARVLPVDYASHSPMVEALEFATTPTRTPRGRWWSTVRSAWVTEALPASYWVENLRRPVRFADAVRALHDDGFDVFVEVSAHPVLATAVAENADAAGAEDVLACGTLRRDQGGPEHLLAALAQAWAGGLAVDWDAVLGAAPTPHVDLPTYPFEHRRFWPEPTARPAPPAPRDPAEQTFWAAVAGRDTASLARTLELSEDLVPALGDLVGALDGWRSRRDRATRTAGWHHEVTWAPLRADDRSASAPAAGPWLVVVPTEVPDDPLQAALEAAPGRPAMITVPVGPDDDRDTVAGRLRDAAADGAAPSAVVSLLADTPVAGRVGAAPGLLRTVVLVGALTDVDLGAPWWWVTRCAVAVRPADVPDAGQAQLWGLGLVTGLDRPDRWGGLVDLHGVGDADLAVRVIAGTRAVGEDQVAIRDGRAYARRLTATTAPPPARPALSGTALVTGGTGALGAHVARALVDDGISHLVLTSRRGPDAPGADELVGDLRTRGATVDVVALDLAGPTGRDRLEALLAEHPPRTVVHAAGVVGDEAPLAARTPDEVAAALAAKVDGAEHLDAALGDTDLDAFVLFSSGAAAWGNAGQAAYAAANAHLDAVAVRRRRAGRPALAVAWGAWDAGGMVDAQVAATLQARGVRSMDPDLALAALDGLLAADAGPTAVVSDMDWGRFVEVYTASGERRLLTDHPAARPAEPGPAVGDGAGSGPGDAGDRAADLRRRLAAATVPERVRVVVEVVRRTAAAALGHDRIGAIGARRSFTDLGFESLTAVDLRNRLAVATGHRLPATAVYDHPSPQRLGEHLLAQLGPVDGAAPPTGGSVLDALAALETSLEHAGGSRPDGIRARLRELADRLGDDGPDDRPVGDADGTVDDDLGDASDDEMFDLIDQELGVV